MNLLRFFRTVRYLRPVQIYSRLWYRVYRTKPDLRSPPSPRTPDGLLAPPAVKQAALVAHNRFKALNEEHDISSPQSWNEPSRDKLWLYNLHYFDDLSADGADARHQWHVALIDRWINENTPTVGNGWEPYPLSLRIVNWVKWLLAGNEPAPDMVTSLAVQARFLCKRLEYHLLGNHLFANAKALVFAGLFYKGSEAAAWLEKGLQLLAREVPEQILSDGGHFELSPTYHSIILEDLLDLHNLVHTFGSGALPPKYQNLRNEWTAAIQKMRYWLKVMCHPDGEIALFNDAVLGVGAGPAEIEAYALRLGLGEVPGPQEGLTCLPASGYIRLARNEAVVILDVGKIGPRYLPGHAHADSLSFELSLFGRRVVVNSGISCYGSSPERLRQRSTAAHTTVEVDGADSSEVWSSFRVGRRAHPIDLSYADEGHQGLVVSCAHDGYTRLPGRVIHRRSWRLTGNRLDITDELEGTYRHAVARFYWHPDIASTATLEDNEKSMSLRLNQHRITWSTSGSQGDLEPSAYHPAFGVSLPNRVMIAPLNPTGTIYSIVWR